MERHVTFLIFKNFATRREVFFSSVDDFKISKPIPALDPLIARGTQWRRSTRERTRETATGRLLRQNVFITAIASI
jgi:hypothetical protein